jgi:hypothetical protein
MKYIAIVSLLALSVNLGASETDSTPKPMYKRAIGLMAKAAVFTGSEALIIAKHVGIGAKYAGNCVAYRLRHIDWEKYLRKTEAVIVGGVCCLCKLFAITVIVSYQCTNMLFEKIDDLIHPDQY